MEEKDVKVGQIWVWNTSNTENSFIIDNIDSDSRITWRCLEDGELHVNTHTVLGMVINFNNGWAKPINTIEPLKPRLTTKKLIFQ